MRLRKFVTLTVAFLFSAGAARAEYVTDFKKAKTDNDNVCFCTANSCKSGSTTFDKGNHLAGNISNAQAGALVSGDAGWKCAKLPKPASFASPGTFACMCTGTPSMPACGSGSVGGDLGTVFAGKSRLDVMKSYYGKDPDHPANYVGVVKQTADAYAAKGIAYNGTGWVCGSYRGDQAALKAGKFTSGMPVFTMRDAHYNYVVAQDGAVGVQAKGNAALTALSKWMSKGSDLWALDNNLNIVGCASLSNGALTIASLSQCNPVAGSPQIGFVGLAPGAANSAPGQVKWSGKCFSSSGTNNKFALIGCTGVPATANAQWVVEATGEHAF